MSTVTNELSPTPGVIWANPLPRQAGVVEECNRMAAPYPAERCIHQLFGVQAALTPDAVAVTFGRQPLAYRELHARADRLANHLVRLGGTRR